MAKEKLLAPPGKLRIIAGSLRGSKLPVPPVPGLRPTPDRVRETLFNWLAPVIEGARCLDLFAGTGALGIEALSRGAAECVFIERDRTLAAAIEANLVRLKVAGGRVRQADALALLGETPTPFDVVFLDPPFAADHWRAAAEKLESGGWLAASAWVYVESPVGLEFEPPPTWMLHRDGRAGEVRSALYRRRAADPLS